MNISLLTTRNIYRMPPLRNWRKFVFFLRCLSAFIWRRNLNKRTVSVIGLGYVGLPVAVAFGKARKTF